MIIDSHLHVFLACSDRYPRGVHELYPADLQAPVESYLEEMEANDVDRAVLVPLTPHDRYVREVVAAHAPLFSWIAVHDPDVADPAADYRRRADGTGLRGLRLGDLGDPEVADVTDLPLFDLLRELRDRGDILWFYGSPQQQRFLERFLERLPDLTVMLNHLGFCVEAYERDEYGRPHIPTALPPPTLPVVQRLARFPAVHVMFSGQYGFSHTGYPYLDLADTARAVLDAYGAERLAWASDFPWIAVEPGYAEQLVLPRTLLPELSDEQHEQIMGGTAARLFGFSS